MTPEQKRAKVEDLKPKEMDQEAAQVKGGFGPVDGKTTPLPVGPIDSNK